MVTACPDTAESLAVTTTTPPASAIRLLDWLSVTVGAGSSVSRDVPDGSLCLTRAPRKDVAHWQRPVKPKKS